MANASFTTSDDAEVSRDGRASLARTRAGGLVDVGGRGELAFDVVDEVEEVAGFPGAVPLGERDGVKDALVGQGRDSLVHGLLRTPD
jgi:hypothetical protein